MCVSHKRTDAKTACISMSALIDGPPPARPSGTGFVHGPQGVSRRREIYKEGVVSQRNRTNFGQEGSVFYSILKGDQTPKKIAKVPRETWPAHRNKLGIASAAPGSAPFYTLAGLIGSAAEERKPYQYLSWESHWLYVVTGLSEP